MTSTKGFTLIEALMAMIILSIAGLGLFQMQGWGSKIFSIQKYRMEQKRLLHNEYHKLSSFNLLDKDTNYEIYSHPCAFEIDLFVLDSIELENQGYLPETEEYLFRRSKEFKLTLQPIKAKPQCKDSLSLSGAIID